MTQSFEIVFFVYYYSEKNIAYNLLRIFILQYE